VGRENAGGTLEAYRVHRRRVAAQPIDVDGNGHWLDLPLFVF